MNVFYLDTTPTRSLAAAERQLALATTPAIRKVCEDLVRELRAALERKPAA